MHACPSTGRTDRLADFFEESAKQMGWGHNPVDEKHTNPTNKGKQYPVSDDMLMMIARNVDMDTLLWNHLTADALAYPLMQDQKSSVHRAVDS